VFECNEPDVLHESVDTIWFTLLCGTLSFVWLSMNALLIH
jgi:hypothetical protein